MQTMRFPDVPNLEVSCLRKISLEMYLPITRSDPRSVKWVRSLAGGTSKLRLWDGFHKSSGFPAFRLYQEKLRPIAEES